MKLLVRFRITAFPNGLEVFNAGKWVAADKTILENIRSILKRLV